MTTNIYLLGAGILGALHLTDETKQALSSSDEVYVLHPDTERIDFIATTYGCVVHDLAGLYGNHTIRRDVYKEISETLVRKAASGARVSFIVHGHPLFLVSASEYTLDLAASAGLNVKVLSAVSSFDTLMCDLRLDYGYALQMFDSTTLLKNNWVVNPEIPLLIFQLSTTNNEHIVFSNADATVLLPLVEQLSKYYPQEHVVHVVHSPTQILEVPEKLSMTLRDLASNNISLDRRPTLYVPSLTGL